MKNYKVEKKPMKTLESIQCDVCKKVYRFDNEEVFEAQEFISIDTECGYGSIFGDMNKIKLDVCQHCLKEKFDEYIRFDNWMDECTSIYNGDIKDTEVDIK